MNDYAKLNEAALCLTGTHEMMYCDILARAVYRRSECGTAWKHLSTAAQAEHNHRKNGRDLGGVSWLRLTAAAAKRLGFPESRTGPMSQGTVTRANGAIAFCYGDKAFQARRAEPAQVSAVLGTAVPDNLAWCVSADCIWRLYVVDSASVTKVVTTVRDIADKLCIDDATRPFVHNAQLGIGIMVPTTGAAAAVTDALREKAIGEPIGHLIRHRVAVYPTIETIGAWLRSWREGGAS
jgi:hypothetical protein